MKYKNKDIKMTIFNSHFIKKNIFIHPWFIGKIFYEDKNFFKVYVLHGILSVKKKDIKFEKKIRVKKNLLEKLYLTILKTY